MTGPLTIILHSCILATRHVKDLAPSCKPLAAQLQHLRCLDRHLRFKVRHIRHDDLIEPGGKPRDKLVYSGISSTYWYPGGRGKA